MALGHELVERFHQMQAADEAVQAFINRFQKNQLPDQIPEISISVSGPVKIAPLLKEAGLVETTSEAFRLLEQGGLKVDQEKVTSKELSFSPGNRILCQVGKRKIAFVTLNLAP